ncbi:MAG: hypothetical protein ACI4OR_01835 [Alphaproteobacteria bacterium]
MGRCCFGKIISGLLILGMAPCVSARCPLADKYAQENKPEMEQVALNVCALSYNDDASQMKMAEGYMKGKNGLKQDERQALYMYQLAAENGNAEAQVKLAELLQSFDTSSERRRELKEYLEKLQKNEGNASSFAGEILHPYTLLLLASERPENKWYYPSLTRSAPARTSVLLQNYQITSEKRQAAMNDASKWKTRKLLEMAQEILTETEYADFETRLKKSATRAQAMTELKDRLTGYVDKKQKERSK